MSEHTVKPESKMHRVDGRLHLVHYVTDENGEKIATVTLPLKVEFRLEDVAQLAAGACVMGLPVAFDRGRPNQMIEDALETTTIPGSLTRAIAASGEGLASSDEPFGCDRRWKPERARRTFGQGCAGMRNFEWASLWASRSFGCLCSLL